MITTFRLENFKAHRDTELVLRPFTLLAGDNSSGKTSVLEALHLAERLATGPTHHLALDELLHRGAHAMQLSADGPVADGSGALWTTSIKLREPGHNDWGSVWELRAGGVESSVEFNGTGPLASEGAPAQALVRIARLMGPARLYRFHSDQVATSAYSDRPDATVAEDGALTPVVLADLKLADDERFNRIEAALRRVVPSLDRLRIGPAMVEHASSASPVRGSKVYFDFHGAKNIPAHHASQGTLIVLALLTVLHSTDRPRLILLDDFDHSLHPRAQIELVRMIKDLLTLEEFRDTQIIATTHSPYVLDEVSTDEVIAFALRDDGTVAAKPLSEHPDAPTVNGSLKAGELWTLGAERDWVR
jgi:predicted ATPase